MKNRIMLLVFLLLAVGLPTYGQMSVEATDCVGGYLDNYEAECGYVILPEDRTQPDGAVVRIAYALLHSRSSTPAPDPIVYLIGGPGSHLITSVADQGTGPMINAWLAQRDVILIDQRGIGLSQPSLACPELDDLQFAADVSEDEAESAIMDAVAACGDRLTAQGLDLSTYTTVANADDMADVPLALGYEQANYLGLSYGSQVVFQIMRRHPEQVRTAIIEGASPPDVNVVLEEGPSFEHALREVFAACAEDSTCAAAYPQLEDITFSLIEQLDEQSISYSYTDPTTGDTSENYVSGRALLHEFHSRLYYPQDVGLFPLVVYAIAGGQVDVLVPFAANSSALDGPSYNTSGAHFVYWCGDYTLSATRAAYDDQIATLPPALQPFYVDVIEDDLQNCGQWDVTMPPRGSQEAVVSDIPTLFLSGRFDPITPASFADHAMQTLSTAYHYVFPTMGHGVGSSSNRCGINIIQQFLADPLTEPDASCVGREPDIDFVLPRP